MSEARAGGRTGSGSGLGSLCSGIGGFCGLVGAIGATMVGGDVGGVAGGVAGGDRDETEEEADSGLHESVRRQLAGVRPSA